MFGSAPSLPHCSSQLGSLRWVFILEKAALAPHMAQQAHSSYCSYGFYSSQILFFGAEFTQVYANRFGSHVTPADNAVAVPKHA